MGDMEIYWSCNGIMGIYKYIYILGIYNQPYDICGFVQKAGHNLTILIPFWHGIIWFWALSKPPHGIQNPIENFVGISPPKKLTTHLAMSHNPGT